MGIMFGARKVVNAISLSRVGLGLLFVVCFQKQVILFRLSVGLFLAMVATDILDGYIARRLNVASVYGRLWDSLGDKAFYIATIVAFNGQGFLGPLVSWALIVREVALYITRILFIEKLPKIEEIRPWTNLHGYFMYLMIVLGLCQMHLEINSFSFTVSPYMQVSAYAALGFGLASIVRFLKIR